LGGGTGAILGFPKRTHLPVTPPITARRTALDVTKLDYEDPSPLPMLRNLQQLDDADKPGAPGKLGRYISEGDLEDLCDHDLARRQLIPASDLHVWPLPKTNGGGDLTATNAVAEASKELHVLSPNRARAALLGALRLLGFGLLPLQRRWAARSLPKRDPTVRGVQRRRLDDNGLLVEAPGVHLELQWPAIQRVVETSELFLFLFNKDGGYYYPKRVLSTAEIDEVRSMIRSHVGGRAMLLG
jgi:hypothetical protein